MNMKDDRAREMMTTRTPEGHLVEFSIDGRTAIVREDADESGYQPIPVLLRVGDRMPDGRKITGFALNPFRVLLTDTQRGEDDD